ncbi:MAG TPA: PSD1 and planctomycete cytochrome C domain-containing protein [Bryobacteraceae bacterium]|nr:PSD1 and planctomycete cytochrome C domain-containing protein [Bryobacteraceae bacterium]
MQVESKLVLLGVAVCFPAVGQGDAGDIFEARIRPMLIAQCYSCHADVKAGGLRVDSREGLLAGGRSGPAIVPGKPEGSLLILAVSRSDPKVRMPLGAAKLTDSSIADLTDWVKAGAPWPTNAPAPPGAQQAHFHISAEQRAFWSFQPLVQEAIPAVNNTAWPRNAIDRFVLAKLEQKNLQPGRPADKHTLIRRATYDLTGLPPNPEEVDAFVADSSPNAFRKVVDRLLASPRYGEKWGRHWLDVARYADGDGRDTRMVYTGYGMAKDGYANTFRYRDWVIDAFNRDLPYDTFVKAQIAADLMPEKDRPDLLAGLGFFGLGPWFTGDDVVFAEARANERDDKIDALTKGFLGLTVACARCHDHKYDPISQKDYHALGGVFASSGYFEHNLVPDPEVTRYKAQLAKVKAQEKTVDDAVYGLRIEVARTLAGRIPEYFMAVRKLFLTRPALDARSLAGQDRLDPDTLLRWARYLSEPGKIEYPFLKPWFALMARGGGTDEEARRVADEFRKLVLDVIQERTALLNSNEQRRLNYQPGPQEARVRLPGDLVQFEMFQFRQQIVEQPINPQRYYVWLDVVQSEEGDSLRKPGIFEFEYKDLVRFLTPAQVAGLKDMVAEYRALQKQLPPEYPYLMTISDNPEPTNLKLNLRGNPHALGEEITRGLPAILADSQKSSSDDPAPFRYGSGRMELAEAIAHHPLLARVMANRVWMHHFGRGIVSTPSNFGAMGERPTHPELLEYLAGRLIENGWSIKALHREIMLSATYQLSSENVPANDDADPENRLLWRGHMRRLDAEEIRDSLLFVAGALDETMGGPPLELISPSNRKRTVYARIRRADYTCTSGTGGVDRMLELFDFADPASSVDQRITTNVPLQGLFFWNSDLMMRQADLTAQRIAAGGGDDAAQIQRAYSLLFGRAAKNDEVKLGIGFLKSTGASGWRQYVQVLLSSGSFYYVN